MVTDQAASFAYTGKVWLNLNGSHGHHFAHAAEVRYWKARAEVGIRAAKCQPVEPPVIITATVRRVRNGKADAHNVTPTIKACIDALVSCGVIPDDHDGIVRRLIIEGGPKAKVPTVELAIEVAT